MKLHDLDEHEPEAKKHAKGGGTPDHSPPLLITRDQHDDKPSESIERCTDAKGEGNGTLDHRIAVHGRVDIAGLKCRRCELFREQVDREYYAKK